MCCRKYDRKEIGCRADCSVGGRARSKSDMCLSSLNHTETPRQLILPGLSALQALVMEVPTGISDQAWSTYGRKAA